MRRFTIISTSLITIALLIIAIAGCGSGQNTNNQASQQKPTSQEEVEVPLAKGFPKDFPLIEGKVTASMINNLTEPKEGRPVGIGYFTQIKTNKTVKQAMGYYKPKFTKITKEEPAKKGKPAMYSGFINNYPVTIYFVDQKDRTMVTIILSGNKK